MKIDRVSSAISPSVVQPQVSTPPLENEPEVPAGEDGSGKANGVVSKLNAGGHFNAVADVRLRIVHFDNAALDKIDPALLPASEDVPGKAYEKFLEQYRALYNASLPPPEPDVPPADEPVDENPTPDPAPVDEEPIVDNPPVSENPPADTPAPDPAPVNEEPVVDTPPVSEEPPATEAPVSDVPGTVSVILPPIEIEPVAATPVETPPQSPVDESTGTFSAFEEFLQTQVSQEPGALDIVI